MGTPLDLLKKSLETILKAEFQNDEVFNAFLIQTHVKKKTTTILANCLLVCPECKKILSKTGASYVKGCMKHGFHRACIGNLNVCHNCVHEKELRNIERTERTPLKTTQGIV